MVLGYALFVEHLMPSGWKNVADVKVKIQKMMNKKDFKYRQGRSKKQVEQNEKLTFYSLVFFLAAFSALLVARLISLIIQ